MNETGVAPRYARALMEAAGERGVVDPVHEDVQGLLNLIRESEDLRGFLVDPLIHPEQKEQVFRTLFSGKVGEMTLNFLLLLCEKRRERVLENILRAFLELWDARRGVATAQVRAARALTPEQESRLSERLSAYSGRQVRLQVAVDPEMRAGVVARLGDQVFDGTVEARLNRLRRLLRP